VRCVGDVVKRVCAWRQALAEVEPFTFAEPIADAELPF